MSNTPQQVIEDIISLLEKLDLNPIQQENQTTYVSACPKNRSHQIIADGSTNRWECKTCVIAGGILELSYHHCLSEIESLFESIKRDVDELNSFLGISLAIKEINEGTLDQFHNNTHKERLQGIIKKKELFQRTYKILDQYRLSIMTQDLKEGKQLNDDIRRWWTNRY